MLKYVPRYGYYLFGVTRQKDGSLYHRSIAVIITDTDNPKRALIQYLRNENLEPLGGITEIEDDTAMTSVQMRMLSHRETRTTITIEQVKLIIYA